MKISIIVPIYNIRKYIERCIESLINQTYDNLEILLVNDGSTDGSGEIIRKYEKDSRIVIIDKKNGGLSDARNAGMKRMTGDYILFVDGDDYLHYDCIQILVNTIQVNTDVVLFPYSKEYGNRSENVKLFSKAELVFEEQDVREKIFARLIGPERSIVPISPVTMDRLNTAWGKLYRKSILEGIEFTDTRLIGPEDCWFNIQVFQNVKNAKYTSMTYYHYEKENNGSLMHNYSRKLIEKRWRMYICIKDYLGIDIEKYNINLSNRIVCEQFGLLINIMRSNLTKSKKRKKIKELLSDERYKEYYEKAEIKKFQFPWSLFFTMCMHQNYNGIILFLSVVNLGVSR